MKTAIYGLLATALLLTLSQSPAKAGRVIDDHPLADPIDAPTLNTTLPDIRPLPLPPEGPKAEPAEVAQPHGGSKPKDSWTYETPR